MIFKEYHLFIYIFDFYVGGGPDIYNNRGKKNERMCEKFLICKFIQQQNVH